jgi:hypothetical protein
LLYRRVADYVVLNKVDMMNEATMASLEAIIASLNPLAKVRLMLVGLFGLVCLAGWCWCVYKCWCEQELLLQPAGGRSASSWSALRAGWHPAEIAS